MRTLLLIMFLVLGACSEKKAETGSDGISIEIAYAGSEQAAPEISSFGTVMYRSKAEVYPTTSTYIRKICAEEGDLVEKDTVLAVLDDSKLRNRLSQALSDLEAKQAAVRLASARLADGRNKARSELKNIRELEIVCYQKKKDYENMLRIFDNKQKLHDAGGLSSEELRNVKHSLEACMNDFLQASAAFEAAGIGWGDTDLTENGIEPAADKAERENQLVRLNTSVLEAELDVAEAELDAADAEVENIKTFLDETIIRAPFRGIVGKRYLDRGESVTPETSLFTVFELDTVYVHTEINASLSGHIGKGQEVKLVILGEEYVGTVDVMAPYADSGSGGRTMKIAVENREMKLYPGLFADVTVLTGACTERTFVPREAVRDGKVFVIRDNRAFESRVNVDFISGDKAYVSSGAEPGTVVAVSGLDILRDGCPVRVAGKGDT